jgi:hypothetical protein
MLGDLCASVAKSNLYHYRAFGYGSNDSEFGRNVAGKPTERRRKGRALALLNTPSLPLAHPLPETIEHRQ